VFSASRRFMPGVELACFWLAVAGGVGPNLSGPGVVQPCFQWRYRSHVRQGKALPWSLIPRRDPRARNGLTASAAYSYRLSQSPASHLLQLASQTCTGWIIERSERRGRFISAPCHLDLVA